VIPKYLEVITDVLIVVGLLAITTGTYLEFGTGYALIVSGVYVAGLAANLARILNNATDEHDDAT